MIVGDNDDCCCSQVVLLLLLSHGGWNGPSVTLLSCTSESSKLVRDVVQKRFLSVVDRYRVSLPLECPLHPRRDMFWWLQTELEATKIEGEETWHCPVCGQKFRCQNTFVTHWDASHAKTLGMAEETVCLDDFCDVFRCDILRKKMLKQRMEEEDELSKPRKQPPKSGIAVLKHRIQDTQEDDEEIREKKKNCDPREMSRIHHKCRSLIRQCTIGMLVNMSSKDFQEIEEDLDESICSFLTCDKYWDDYDAHVSIDTEFRSDQITFLVDV
ncbi:c2H2-type domain-containing protein [Caerostris darwini]|uniref:C2H2-type domain-containing protein n=1 Tax=Caerostris darwini TaxID=1538125 RepID=A0AAV4WK30_9ARAC|nr:c2H2-type domain-containing protein [Caerostris darwini]